MSFLKLKVYVLIYMLGVFCLPLMLYAAEGYQGIMPWKVNPSYWQYKGEPVLLLGATDNDNLFQNDNIESQLDRLKTFGGNYIRNTMSDRDDGDQRAFFRNADGMYDLDRWNDEYWYRFENMLNITKKRNIIVQIEIWDRFDHSREAWQTDPYNPKNNINYTYAESGLDSIYESPSNYDQPFFSTVPDLDSNMVLLKYQNKFVEKLLSITINYDHILFCIDNETTGIRSWAIYWSNFIREKYQGKEVFITQMWNNHDIKSDVHKGTLDYPEQFDFLEFSQNSHNTGRSNWDFTRYIFDYIRENPRPVNSTKIYGSDTYTPWLDRGITTDHAVQTFFRNLLGGFASSRFHRPPHGIGLSQTSINALRTVRRIEEYIKMWEIVPRMDLLPEAVDNSAYLSALEGEKYLLYLPFGGQTRLDLTAHEKEFVVHWIITDTAHWGPFETIRGGSIVNLDSGTYRGCFAIIVESR
jgi:hypothetical protein